MKRSLICLMLVLCVTAANAAQNLFDMKDISRRPGRWGQVKNKPIRNKLAGQPGKVDKKGAVLTITRKTEGGDLKLVRSFPADSKESRSKLLPNTQYRFLCKLKKGGPGAAKINILCRTGGKWGILVTESYAKGGEWQDVEIHFKTPDVEVELVGFQFFPPDEIGGSISLSQFTLLAGSNERSRETILKPVVITKTYKPIKKLGEVNGLALYPEGNLLRNGDFKKRQFHIDLPLFWQHTYGWDASEKRKKGCYSLKDGIFGIKSPFSVRQFVDIAPEVASQFRISCRARVLAGSASCSVMYRSLKNQSDYSLARRRMPLSKKWRNYEFSFDIKPEQRAEAGTLMIGLAAGNAEFDHIVLTPVPPKDAGKAKNPKGLYIEGEKEMCPARGICLAGACSGYEVKAAKYLQKYLFLASGQLLPIYVVEGDKPSERGLHGPRVKDREGLFFVGSEFVSEQTRGNLTLGGYAIRVANGTAYIGARKGDDGAIHGVLRLLQDLGIEFFTMTDYSLPEEKILCVEMGHSEANPAIGYHFALGAGRLTSSVALGHSDFDLMPWGRRIGRWDGCIHTSSLLVDPHVFFEDHPEYFAMNGDGKRAWPSRGPGDLHLCMSNPDVQRIATETVLKWIDAEPWGDLFFVSPGDGHGWCTCENCRKWDVETNEPAGTLSDRNLRFVNVVAREVAKTHPDKTIMTLAYCGCRKVPREVKPEPNVGIMYCTYPPSWTCANHLLCPGNRRGVKELSEWALQYPGQIFIYDYPLFGERPKSGLYVWVEKIQMYANLGIRGLYLCGQKGNDDFFNYVLNKVIWDPQTDVEAHIDRFMTFHYGDALAPVMREYFNLVAEKEQVRSLHRYDQVPVDDDFLDRGRKLLDRALEIAEENESPHIGEICSKKRHLFYAHLASFNKAKGLLGDELKRYAVDLAELLNLYIECGVEQPAFRVTVRDMLMRDALIDIGDHKPWHSSPVIKALLKDPVALITQGVGA
jgi:hypothetical protein